MSNGLAAKGIYTRCPVSTKIKAQPPVASYPNRDPKSHGHNVLWVIGGVGRWSASWAPSSTEQQIARSPACQQLTAPCHSNLPSRRCSMSTSTAHRHLPEMSVYNALWQALKLNAHNTDNRRTGYYLALDLFRALNADRISKESTRALGKKRSLSGYEDILKKIFSSSKKYS